MIYKIQIDDQVRDATPDEAAAIKQMQDDHVARINALQLATSAKASARAKLNALGLTDDEIAALVG